MTTTEAKPKKIKITLSDRAPVTIVADEWPTIARASGWRGGSGHECQANEEMYIRVRAHDADPTAEHHVPHADGRVIVHGYRDSGPGGMPITYRGARAGYLLTPEAGQPVSQAEIVRAIRRVAGVIGWEEGAADCIADLPAEEI